MDNIYPGSSPELRIYVDSNGVQHIQVRYVNISHGYTSKWQNIPIIYENINAETVDNSH